MKTKRKEKIIDSNVLPTHNIYRFSALNVFHSTDDEPTKRDRDQLHFWINVFRPMQCICSSTNVYGKVVFSSFMILNVNEWDWMYWVQFMHMHNGTLYLVFYWKSYIQHFYAVEGLYLYPMPHQRDEMGNSRQLCASWELSYSVYAPLSTAVKCWIHHHQ